MQAISSTSKAPAPFLSAYLDVAPSVRVVALDGKGLGVVATRSFSRGERVLAERPLVALVADEWSSTSIFDNAISEIKDAAARAAFHDLMQAPKYGTDKTCRGIWLSNAYPAATRSDGRKVRPVC